MELSTLVSMLAREKGCTAAVSILGVTFAILNCWWFIFLPHRQAYLPIFASTSNSTSIACSNQTTSPSASLSAISSHTYPQVCRSSNRSSSTASACINQTKSSSASPGNCDIFQGKWVPDSSPPLYTNDTCKYIQPSQNCMQNGRPDRGYLNWKWKPNDCELLHFDPATFLALLRGKKLVFIGDSIARNQMQALLCALSQVEDPQNLFDNLKDKELKWGFPSYNFTLANLWSPFLVNYTHTVEQDIYKLQLDMPDELWSSRLAEYDMAVISTGYWYFRPSIYYFNHTILGANPLAGLNLTTLKLVPVLTIVLANVLKYMVNEYRGITMLRTVTVDHFEYGSWDDGGVCNRTRPFTEPDMQPLSMPWMSNEMNKVQVEEFEKAVAFPEGSLRLKLLNVTYSAFMRPDGHPGSYRTRQPSEPQNDCLHWCLPEPIDMWNQLILHILERDFFSL